MASLSGNLAVDFLGFLVALICILVAYIKYQHNYWKRRNFPYLEPSFPWGNMQNPFDKNRVALGPHLENVYNEMKKKGLKYCGVSLITSPGLMVTDLDLVKQLMTKDFHYFMDRGIYYNERTDPLSAHLVSLAGNKWKNLRRKVTPTFTSGKMKAMFPILVECTHILKKQMLEEIKMGGPLDIREILGDFTTDIIGSCAFGLECNSFEDKNSLFRVYGKRFFHQNFWDAFKFSISTAFPNFCEKLGMIVLNPDLSNFFTKIVRDTIDYRVKNKVVRNDFLQLMIEMKDEKDEYKGDGNTLTFNEIASQCLIFFGAGFETSSTAMTFTLLELSQNQEIQDRARDEIIKVLKKYNGEITYDAINEMTYLQQVLDESMRLYPPVPGLPRICTEDYKFPDSDVVIEKGTRLTFSIMGIHHDPDNHKDPFKFDPDRFSPENVQKMHPFAYIPFGEGPRVCIGLRFGVMQAKVGLATLLSNFRFTLNKKTKFPLKIAKKLFVLSTEDGVFLDCEPLK